MIQLKGNHALYCYIVLLLIAIVGWFHTEGRVLVLAVLIILFMVSVFLTFMDE